MEYIHTDGSIKTIVEIKKEHANTSFPSIGIDKALEEFGYSLIHPVNAPENNDIKKIYIRDGVEQNSDKQWVYKWALKDRHADIEGGKTKDQQDAEYKTILDNHQKDVLRTDRKPLLEEADWQIHKLEDAGGDASKWKTYRQALRDITKASDIYDVTWPTKPS
jgi:hypothetical protein